MPKEVPAVTTLPASGRLPGCSLGVAGAFWIGDVGCVVGHPMNIHFCNNRAIVRYNPDMKLM